MTILNIDIQQLTINFKTINPNEHIVTIKAYDETGNEFTLLVSQRYSSYNKSRNSKLLELKSFILGHIDNNNILKICVNDTLAVIANMSHKIKICEQLAYPDKLIFNIPIKIQ